MLKLIRYTILLLISVYVILLYGAGRITLYIHWRYEVFTYAFAIFAAVLSIVGILRVIEQQGFRVLNFKSMKKMTASDWGGVIVLVVIICIGFLLPPRSLSVAAASQRQIEFDIVDLEQTSAAELFLSDTKSLDMGDWVTAMAYDPNPQRYLEKEVEISGFALFNDNFPDDTFKLSRFVLTCCVVDARPVGLLISENPLSAEINLPEIEAGQWYQVTGKFVQRDSGLVIAPAQITVIEEPNDPYLL